MSNRLDLLELGNVLTMFYASIIPFYFAYRLFPGQGRSFAYLSILLGVMLLVHSIHHLGEFIGDTFLNEVFGLASALLAVMLGVVYSFLRRRVR